MSIAFFGHHKCASTSVSHLCYDLANDIGYDVIYKKTAFDKTIPKEFNSKHNNFLISLNSTYDVLKEFKDFKGFHIIRDPRDICVSGYFSHRNTHQTVGFDRLIPHKEKLLKMSFEEGLIEEFSFSNFWIQHLASWNYTDPRILEIKIEDIMNNPIETWNSIFDWLSLVSLEEDYLFKAKSAFNRLANKLNARRLKCVQKIPDKRKIELIDRYSFKNLSKGRKQGQENLKSHYRKGKSGDWENYFNSDHKIEFKKLYGQLLIDLGYEKDLSW